MGNKSIYELGILAQKGDEMAMLEIIDRKKPLLKKYSFGDEDRIRTGKKIIKGSLFSYTFILAIDLILSAIKSLIS